MTIPGNDRFKEVVQLTDGLVTLVWLSDWERAARNARRVAIFCEELVEKERVRTASIRQLELGGVR